MTERNYDYVIIGQGLAGSLLAHELISRDQRVMVIDNQHHHSASQVAAGLINPITGHRLNITEDFDRFYAQAEQRYTHLNGLLKETVFAELNQTRLIKNAGQANYYQQRLQQTEYQNLLAPSDTHTLIDAGYGCTRVKQSAVVDTKILLKALKDWLVAKSAYIQKRVDYPQIQSTPTGFTLADINTKRLIFCEGYQAINNPWLTHLPFTLAKGEIITLQINTTANTLLSWGNWLLSNHDGRQAKLGATYDWNDLTHTPSDAARTRLMESLATHTTLDANVLAHEVGIRPTTTQRKPFIGPIPTLPKAYCFNGFGSKGCLIIPFYAKLLSKHLLKDEPLPVEITQWI